MSFDEAWRRALLRRRKKQQTVVVEMVAGIGELSTTDVIVSLPSSSRPSTGILFDYTSSSSSLPDDNDNKYVLYWIDEEGSRHHGYRFHGQQWKHRETSHAGHAFALCDATEDQQQLVLAYRARASLHAPQVHHVKIHRDNHQLTVSVEIGEPLCEARVMAGMRKPALMPSSAADDWEICYQFSVPSVIPPFADFDEHTVYVWGDLTFDEFDFAGKRRVTECKMNQLVPQVMIGRCLSSASPVTYEPEWTTFTSWVAQAQYYYQTELGEEHGSKAMCGEWFDVLPGERMESRFKYTSGNGEMVVSIQSVDRPALKSEVRCTRPFPSQKQKLNKSWREFFALKQGGDGDGLIKAQCTFNIEYKADEVDLRALESMCPLRVHSVDLIRHTSSDGEAAVVERYASPDSFARAWRVRGMNFEQEKRRMVQFG